MKPRSLPSSSLDHANQNGFHLPHDPYASPTSKTPSRTSHIDHSRKSQQNSPVRYHPGRFIDSLLSISQISLIKGQHNQVFTLLLCPKLPLLLFSSINVLLFFCAMFVCIYIYTHFPLSLSPVQLTYSSKEHKFNRKKKAFQVLFFWM